MSDSDCDEENYCYYGTSLDPYDEDTFPKKRPITVEEQVAKDAQGRRRFHGAFTGGFSAGFFNTVGSLEGWKPQEFKSSRADKAEAKQRRPEDYMDDEDLGEFGIAPQAVRATEEFANKKKRKKQAFSNGPIPGEPVLQTLLESGNETVGFLLLRNMGLKHKDEDNEEVEEQQQGTKIYGCEMPKVTEIKKAYDCLQYDIPRIYKEFLGNPKSNTAGLGHQSLDRTHINLFQSTNLIVNERNNKKLSISGQAFGVGAFEDEDEDIYVKENMNRYDFELTSERGETSKNKQIKNIETVFDMYEKSKKQYSCTEVFLPPTIPQSFSGKHKVKKSRFEPLPDETQVVERKNMNAEIRAKYLGENSAKPPTFPKPIKPVEIKQEQVETIDSRDTQPTFGGFSGILLDRFVSGGHESSESILTPVQKTETDHGTKEMRDAARLKMFGPLTRVSCDWQPCALLCKRFNVPEPFSGNNEPKNKKRTKNLIFEYQREEESTVLKPGLSIQKTETETANDTISESVNVGEPTEDPATSVAISSQDIEQPSITTTTENTVNAENVPKQIPEENDLPKDLTEKIDASKNVDLFRAVFLSSSESEEEDEEERKEVEDRSSEFKKTIVEEQLIPKIIQTKEGILSGVNFAEIRTSATSQDSNTTLHKREEDNRPVSNSELRTDDLIYGPTLPGKITNKCEIPTNIESSDDEWVESNRTSKKSPKHKKNKKEKYEHSKKHKHKKKKKRCKDK